MKTFIEEQIKERKIEDENSSTSETQDDLIYQENHSNSECMAEDESHSSDQEINLADLKDPLVDVFSHLLSDADRACPVCGVKRSIVIGPFGPYLKCENLCVKSKSIPYSIQQEAFEILQIPCRDCKNPMIIARKGKNLFPGCSNYPNCKTWEFWTHLSKRLKERRVRKKLGGRKTRRFHKILRRLFLKRVA